MGGVSGRGPFPPTPEWQALGYFVDGAQSFSDGQTKGPPEGGLSAALMVMQIACFRRWLIIADAPGPESRLNCQEFLKLHVVEIGQGGGCLVASNPLFLKSSRVVPDRAARLYGLRVRCDTDYRSLASFRFPQW
jgi:hypothetical protein